MISTQNILHIEPVEKRSRFMKSVGYVDFDEVGVEVGVIQIGSFSKQNGMWHDLSIIFNEMVLSNKFSFEPQHSRFFDTYICLDIYPGTVGVAAIEM